MVYDITDRNSFENIKGWFNEIEKYASEHVNKIIVGNKCDLEDKRKISIEEGQEVSRNLGVNFLETSAKSSNNVGEAFSVMAQEIKSKIAATAKVVNKARGEKVSSGHVISPKKSNCC